MATLMPRHEELQRVSRALIDAGVESGAACSKGPHDAHTGFQADVATSSGQSSPLQFSIDED